MQDPTDAIVISTTRSSSDTHTLQANVEGKYTYCFSNEFSTVSEKKIGFNIHENIQKIHESIKGKSRCISIERGSRLTKVTT